MELKITINNAINTSLQVGDMVYYARIENGVLTEPFPRGGMRLKSINEDDLVVEAASATTIPAGSFILFSKPIQVNESSVKGYYADVTLENHSTKRAELFAISSEIVPSSK